MNDPSHGMPLNLITFLIRTTPWQNYSSDMEYFKMETYILILFSLCITSSLSFTADLASAHDTDRLARVESLLETVISKNQELEKRVEQLEIQLKGQKTVNDELLNRISKFESIQNNNAKADSLENVTLNVTCDRNSGIQNRSNHDHLHTEKQKNPQIKRNKTRANKSKYNCMYYYLLCIYTKEMCRVVMSEKGALQSYKNDYIQ